jgi:hypothetical protein
MCPVVWDDLVLISAAYYRIGSYAIQRGLVGWTGGAAVGCRGLRPGFTLGLAGAGGRRGTGFAFDLAASLCGAARLNQRVALLDAQQLTGGGLSLTLPPEGAVLVHVR